MGNGVVGTMPSVEVCKEFLPKPGGLLHVISNLSDTIEIGKERYDIIMPKLAHGFDTSLSRFLGYAFYKSSGDDDNMKITINGKAVSHLKETCKRCGSVVPQETHTRGE